MAITIVETVSKEMVKPTLNGKRNPNPTAGDVVVGRNHPKIHTLSLFDQVVSQTYVPLIFFYRRPPQSSTGDHDDDQPAASVVLKASLAATLCDFYPLAGRIRAAGSTVVDCNDEGPLFLEARAVGRSLREFVDDYVSAAAGEEMPLMKPLVPDGFGAGESYCCGGGGGGAGGGLIPLAVQVTSFRCGGMAVCASFAHCVMDMGGISYFLRTWAAHAAGGELPPLPAFNLSALYPPADDVPMEIHFPAGEKIGVRAGIVFDYPMVEALKREARSEQVQNPSSVEAVTALIHLTAIKAAAAARGDSNRTKNLIQSVNLRGRVTPRLPENAMGNLVGFYSVVGPLAEEATLAGLVGEIRREKGRVFSDVQAMDKDQLRSNTLEKMKAIKARGGAERRRGGASQPEHLVVTSWCGFGLYELDFGWGNPVWAVRGPRQGRVNGAELIDMKGDRSIEAGIVLEQEEMAVFLSDEKLRAYGRINPNPLESARELKLGQTPS